MNDLAYNEEPLAGMVPKTVSQMTEEELRAHVQNIRTLRSSAQTLKANMAIAKSIKASEKADAKLTGLFDL